MDVCTGNGENQRLLNLYKTHHEKEYNINALTTHKEAFESIARARVYPLNANIKRATFKRQCESTFSQIDLENSSNS
jgi:hypothetical protein